SPYFKSFVAEGPEYLFRHISLRMFGEGRIGRGYFVIRFLCIKHSKTIVVLRRKDHVFHSRCFCSISPLVRVKIGRIKGLLQILIVSYVLVVSLAMLCPALCPALILGTKTPAFYNSPLAISPPVHKKAELQILPGLQILNNQRIIRWLIAGRDVVGLGEGKIRIDNDQCS